MIILRYWTSWNIKRISSRDLVQSSLQRLKSLNNLKHNNVANRREGLKTHKNLKIFRGLLRVEPTFIWKIWVLVGSGFRSISDPCLKPFCWKTARNEERSKTSKMKISSKSKYILSRSDLGLLVFNVILLNVFYNLI